MAIELLNLAGYLFLPVVIYVLVTASLAVFRQVMH
jgi:hypothetical protein